MPQLTSPDSHTVETTDIKDMEMIVFPANIDQAKDQLGNILHKFDDEGKRIEITDLNEKMNVVINEIQRFSSSFLANSEWNKQYFLMLIELYSAYDTQSRFGFFAPNTHYHELMNQKKVPHITDYDLYDRKKVTALHGRLKINPRRKRNPEYPPNAKLGISLLNIYLYGSPGSGNGIFTEGLDTQAKARVLDFYQETEKYLRGENALGYNW